MKVFAVLFIFICVASTILADRDYWNVIPKFRAQLKQQQAFSWQAKCFQSTNATIRFDSKAMHFEWNVQQAAHLLCSDFYLVASHEKLHIKQIAFKGKHSFSYAWSSPQEYADVVANGISIFEIDQSIINIVLDLWDLAGLFIGPKMVRNNIEFVEQYMNVTFKTRPVPFINLTENDIQSGDHFGILNFYEGEPLILYGTGSMTDHHAMALRIDGELYVVESAGTTVTHGKMGVMRTPWTKWFADVVRMQQLVVLNPLSVEARAKFNETKAVEFFKSIEGNNYGFHNFIFGWIDTPSDNFPHGLTDKHFAMVTAVLDKLDHKLCKKMILDALNMRLGTKDLNAEQVFQTCQDRNMTFGELISIPERDSWVYEDGPSMVCNVFVARMYKESGVLPYDFEATETTPRDLYQLNIFDKTGKRPKACQIDDLPYCQIAGTLQLELPGLSTIEPYAQMFDHCGALPPKYERFPAKC